MDVGESEKKSSEWWKQSAKKNRLQTKISTEWLFKYVHNNMIILFFPILCCCVHDACIADGSLLHPGDRE